MRELPATDFFGIHRDKPCIIFGNGPSLNLLEPYKEHLQKHFITIGMNQSWKFMKANYHCIMFHRDQLDELPKWADRKTILWTFKDYSEIWVRDLDEGAAIFVPAVCDPKDPMHVHNIFGLISTDLSENSYADMTGHYALEVALWMRCRPIYLVGFDLYGKHFCTDSIVPVETEWQDIQVEMWEETVDYLDKDFGWATVYNLNPESRIQGFPKVPIEEILDGLRI